MSNKKNLTEDEKSKLDELYQDSIEKLEDYWESAREQNEPDIVVDQIFYTYEEQIKQILQVTDLNLIYEIFDFGPRDYFYECVDAGIN